MDSPGLIGYQTSARMRRLALPLLLGLSGLVGACGDGPEAAVPTRNALADKWLVRAKQSYRGGDLDDACQAIDGAMKAAPKDIETRLVGARIALAKLDYNEAIGLTENIPGSDAKGVRGRAFWYAGDIERAADELDDMMRDPNVKDPWARDVSKLARRGQGRHPFAIEGGVVAAVEMPPELSPALVVPCELDGENILALVATNFGELMIDSASRKEPAWVNLRFDRRVEIKDVPALTHDLTNVSRQLGAPIKALLGVNVLRHMHVTFDRRASQFVVRKTDPPAPPEASRLPLFYARGGAMMMRGSVSAKEDGTTLFFVDSSAFYPLALDDNYLKRSGANLASFTAQPGAPANWKMGYLPHFKLGTVELPQVPAMQGPNIGEYKQTFDVDLGGIVGAGLLAAFRVTFGEDGRWLWLELDETLMGPARGAPPPPPTQGGQGVSPPLFGTVPRPPGPGPVTPPKPTPAPGPPPAPVLKPGPTPAPTTVPKPPPAPAPPPGPGALTPKPQTESKGAAK